MTDDERADIEALAERGCCPATITVASAHATTQDQCLLEPHSPESVHQGSVYVWSGPPQAIRRSA
jgi:hypothetical protein